MRKAILIPLLSLSALLLVACGGSGESPGADTPASLATSVAATAPVIPNSKELTTIYFVHAEW
jgi:uncharacterized protein YcfL